MKPLVVEYHTHTIVLGIKGWMCSYTNRDGTACDQTWPTLPFGTSTGSHAYEVEQMVQPPVYRHIAAITNAANELRDVAAGCHAVGIDTGYNGEMITLPLVVVAKVCDAVDAYRTVTAIDEGGSSDGRRADHPSKG